MSTLSYPLCPLHIRFVLRQLDYDGQCAVCRTHREELTVRCKAEVLIKQELVSCHAECTLHCLNTQKADKTTLHGSNGQNVQIIIRFFLDMHGSLAGR